MLDFPSGTVDGNPPVSTGDCVQSLVREEPTCHRATKAGVSQLLSPHAAAAEAPMLLSLCSTTREDTAMRTHEPRQRVAPTGCH